MSETFVLCSKYLYSKFSRGSHDPRVIWRLETLEARIHFEITKHISRHTCQKIEKYIKQKARKTMTKFTLFDTGTF